MLALAASAGAADPYRPTVLWAQAAPPVGWLARDRVPRLVDAERAKTRHLDLRQDAPALVGRLGDDAYAASAQVLERRGDVARHQIELVARIAAVGRMDGDLGGREREDQPAAAGVDRVEP